MSILGCALQECVSLVFCVITLLVFIIGIAIVAFGAVVFMGQDTLMRLVDAGGDDIKESFKGIEYVRSGATGLMVIGAVVMIVGFLGCCGVFCRNRSLILAFGCCVLVIVLVEIAAGVIVFKFKDEVRAVMTDGLKNAINKYYGDSEVLTQAIDYIQTLFACCGVKGSEDFMNSTWYQAGENNEKRYAPVSCCKLKDDAKSGFLETLKENLKQPLAEKEYPLLNATCPHSKPGPDNPNTDIGCIDMYYAYLEMHATAVLGIAAFVVGLELIASVVAFCMARRIQEEDMERAGVVVPPPVQPMNVMADPPLDAEEDPPLDAEADSS